MLGVSLLLYLYLATPTNISELITPAANNTDIKYPNDNINAIAEK